MFTINGYEGVNSITFGMDVKEVREESRSFTDETPKYSESYLSQELEYKNTGIFFVFFSNKLTQVGFNEGVIAQVLGVDIYVGSTTRKEIKDRLDSLNLLKTLGVRGSAGA